MKDNRLIAIGVTVAAIAAAAAVFSLYKDVLRPARVWVKYSEKYKDGAGGERDDLGSPAGNEMFAEVGLQEKISRNNGCIVLTHTRQQADYVVDISVVRFVGGDIYGEAGLSITKKGNKLLDSPSLQEYT